jgi:hypothetical protein
MEKSRNSLSFIKAIASPQTHYQKQIVIFYHCPQHLTALNAFVGRLFRKGLPAPRGLFALFRILIEREEFCASWHSKTVLSDHAAKLDNAGAAEERSPTGS